MARRREHSRETLAELALCAAERLLDEQGIAELSTRRIAADIGYSAATLYSVFDNLDDLCWQLNARTLAQLLAQLDALGEMPPREALKAYALCYVAFAARWPERWSLLFEHRTPETLQVPAWLNASIERLFLQIEGRLAELVPEASASERALTARTLWSGVHGVAVLQLRGKLFLPPQGKQEQMLTTLVDYHLDGWSLSRESRT
ncbi:TetR/AcrR family transcriptional regulator [Marinobacterium rhizophilum]|uniref:TetR/AcrR family transcriptional regulator n=1 Tax=Marinobacterium rhizophilum TaxID=420402 RepID=A0ABY5HK72_9GAMM|nr:TetR/AcrR family transcriptional regulator [Marinobacterium rhizophilum]UTW12519.1 TetR/AcrR family transcriptional regulator [Marinobacterium rhizophilum]